MSWRHVETTPIPPKNSVPFGCAATASVVKGITRVMWGRKVYPPDGVSVVEGAPRNGMSTVVAEDLVAVTVSGMMVNKRDLLPPCPDCKGTGKYVGFTSTEDCKTCGGKGS